MQAVYLLHFFKPISKKHTTQHYLGYGHDVDVRIEQQRRGRKNIAANLCYVAKRRRIKFVVAKLWIDGDRKLERQLKNKKNHKKLCPICNGTMPSLSADINFY